jgi:hypothetical protein
MACCNLVGGGIWLVVSLSDRFRVSTKSTLITENDFLLISHFVNLIFIFKLNVAFSPLKAKASRRDEKQEKV